jgi:hypothetical protein
MDDYGWGGDHYRAFRRLRQAVRRLAEGSGKTSERLHDVTSLALGWPRARGTLPGAALGRIGMSIDWRMYLRKGNHSRHYSGCIGETDPTMELGIQRRHRARAGGCHEG